jgi:hypothetical protein
MTRIQQEQALTTPSPFLYSKTTNPVGFWTTLKRSMPGCSVQFPYRNGAYSRQFTAHKFGSFMHARQAPVSRAAVVGQNLVVYVSPIIANSHLQLVLVIVDLRFDPREKAKVQSIEASR